MKVIIIGNGVAGQTVAEKLRRTNKDMEISIVSQEPHPYYSRIFLPKFIAGERELEKLYIRKNNWYEENNIRYLPETKVTQIDLKNKTIHSPSLNDVLEYEKLILAVGSSARKLPFENPGVNGNFALRTIADAQNIQNFIKIYNVKDAFIVGGGLLGIELGFHIRKTVSKVTICEIAPQLLPRQLDNETSKVLQSYLEKQGLNFILGESLERIIGEERVEGVKTQGGVVLNADMVLQQLGIIPNIELARISGLKTGKGIIVDHYMRTSDPDVYAVGDCIEFEEKIWGIIPASLEQAKQAAAHLLNQNPDPYIPSMWNTRLKVAGIDLTCIGLSSPDAEEGAELFEYTRRDNYTCRKVLIRGNVLTNAVLLGPGSDPKFFLKKAGKEVDPQEIDEKIRE